MAPWAHDDRMERSLASRLDRSKERERVDMFQKVRENLPELAKRMAMKLIDARLLETNSKQAIEEQLQGCLEEMLDVEEFDINYAVAPYRQVAVKPNPVALYLTAFVVEKLINHQSVVDVFGSDEQIYKAIMTQLEPFLSKRAQFGGDKPV